MGSINTTNFRNPYYRYPRSLTYHAYPNTCNSQNYNNSMYSGINPNNALTNYGEYYYYSINKGITQQVQVPVPVPVPVILTIYL